MRTGGQRTPASRSRSSRRSPRSTQAIPFGGALTAITVCLILLVLLTRILAGHFHRGAHTPYSTPVVTNQIATLTSAASSASVTTASDTTASTPPAPTVSGSTPNALTPLLPALQHELDDVRGTYGIWIADLPTGSTIGIHAHQQFIAASVIKTYIIAALYAEVAAGKISLNDTMTTTAADIQNYGTGSIRYDPVGTTYTLADLATRAAKESDNTAAYLLTKRLGMATIQQLVTSWGMTDTNVAKDRTTPADIGLLFLKLAQRTLLPAPQDLDVLGLLVDTDFEDRLPALLPDYALVSHKIGTETNGVINDAGLVVLPTRSYVIAVLSTGTDPTQAIPTEQRLSQIVFRYEARLP